MADTENTIKTKVVVDANAAEREIVKLNAAASDTTKELEKRIEAKNEAVELQEKLSKQTISNLEKEIKLLEESEASTKEIEKAQKRLNREKLKATKIAANNEKQQNKLTEAQEKAESAMGILDNATGGLIGTFTTLSLNPIVLVMGALVGIFKLLQKAVSRSGKASSTFNKIFAKLSAIFNGILAVLEPVVEFLGEKLLFALENPKKAIKELGDFILKNIINRFKAFLVLGEAVTLLLKGEFKKAAKKAGDGMIQLTTGVENATEKVQKFGEESVKRFEEAADATEKLANKERQLARNRIALEKQQLRFQNLAEKERQIRDDVSKSIDERIKANKRLGETLDKQSKIELALAQQSLALARQQVVATGETVENLEAVGDAEIKVLEIQERITGQRSEQLVNEQALLKERADLTIKFAEMEVETAKARGKKTLDAEKKVLDLKMQQELTAMDLTEQQKQIIRDKYAALKEEKDKAEKEKADKKKADELEKEREAAQKKQEAQNELDELNIERRRFRGEEVLALEKELLDKKLQQDLAAENLSAEQRKLIQKKYDFAVEKMTKDSEKAKADSKKKGTEMAIGFVAEQFGVEKEAAVASMIIRAPEAIGNSFSKAAATYPFPLSVAMGALGAAGTVAPIIKGLADIKKTRFSKAKGSSSGSGGSVSKPTASGGGGGATPVTTSAITDLAGINQNRPTSDPSVSAAAAGEAASNIAGSTKSEVTFSEDRYSEFQQQVGFKEEKTSI